MKGYRSHYPSLHKLTWIGGYSKGGNWYWKEDLADASVTVTDWAKGEPNGNGDMCMALYGDIGHFTPDQLNSSLRFRFDDFPCAYPLPYICEKSVKI